MTTLLLTYNPEWRDEGLTLEQQADLAACKEEWSKEMEDQDALERIMKYYYED